MYFAPHAIFLIFFLCCLFLAETTNFFSLYFAPNAVLIRCILPQKYFYCMFFAEFSALFSIVFCPRCRFFLYSFYVVCFLPKPLTFFHCILPPMPSWSVVFCPKNICIVCFLPKPLRFSPLYFAPNAVFLYFASIIFFARLSCFQIIFFLQMFLQRTSQSTHEAPHEMSCLPESLRLKCNYLWLQSLFVSNVFCLNHLFRKVSFLYDYIFPQMFSYIQNHIVNTRRPIRWAASLNLC